MARLPVIEKKRQKIIKVICTRLVGDVVRLVSRKRSVDSVLAHLTVYNLEGAGQVGAWVVVLLVINITQIIL